MTINRREALAYAAGAGAVLAAVPAKAARGNTDLEAALATLHSAMVAGDGVALDRMMHPDLIYMHSSGFYQTKAELMRDLAGKRFFAAFNPSGMHMQRTGDTALATMTVDQVKNVAGGKARASQIKVIYTLVLRRGKWQLLDRCSALMPTRPSASAAPAVTPWRK